MEREKAEYTGEINKLRSTLDLKKQIIDDVQA
jgi:hypothetical protein